MPAPAHGLKKVQRILKQIGLKIKTAGAQQAYIAKHR